MVIYGVYASISSNGVEIQKFGNANITADGYTKVLSNISYFAQQLNPGIDDPDSPIGTDPLKVMEAIESVADTDHVLVMSLVSSETFINLIERKVDVAIRAGTLTDSSLRARPLFTSYRKIVASPDYVARYGMPQHPSDLKQHHCLGFTEPG